MVDGCVVGGWVLGGGCCRFTSKLHELWHLMGANCQADVWHQSQGRVSGTDSVSTGHKWWQLFLTLSSLHHHSFLSAGDGQHREAKVQWTAAGAAAFYFFFCTYFTLLLLVASVIGLSMWCMYNQNISSRSFPFLLHASASWAVDWMEGEERADTGAWSEVSLLVIWLS